MLSARFRGGHENELLFYDSTEPRTIDINKLMSMPRTKKGISANANRQANRQAHDLLDKQCVEIAMSTTDLLAQRIMSSVM